MVAAERDITVVAADFGLGPGGDRLALFVDAKVHRRLAAAFADRLELDHRIREGKKRSGSRKELPLEIGSKAVAEHRDSEPVGDLAQLQNMPLREELRFVDEDAVDLALLQFFAD